MKPAFETGLLRRAALAAKRRADRSALAGDGVKERPRHVSTPAAHVRHGSALRIGDVEKRLVIRAIRNDRRMMEFMAANDVAYRADRVVGEQSRLTIPEVQAALGKARRVAEQPGHRMADAVLLLKTSAQRHVAAALAMN